MFRAMTRPEFRTLTLPVLLGGVLLSTGCFTPEDYGAGVAVEAEHGEHGEAGEAGEHGEAGEAEHAAAEHTAEPEAHGGETVPAQPEGILPGTTGKRLEIEIPEIEYTDDFQGKPIATETIEDGVVVETFVSGDGEPVGDSALVEFSFTGWGTATGQKVMGSRAGPSKIVVNDAAQKDPFATALVNSLRGRKAGDKIRVKVPSSLYEDEAPPHLLAHGDMILTIEILSTKPMAKLAGVEAYSGEPIATQKLDSGLEIYDYRAGEGDAAAEGDTVITHYIGQIAADGSEFDNSHGRPEGLSGIAGGPGLIKGFSDGLVGARPGMLRKLVIPPEIGYGSADRGKIPPNSTLVFYLEIQEVRDASEQSVRIGPDGKIRDTPKPQGDKPKNDKPKNDKPKGDKPKDDEG